MGKKWKSVVATFTGISWEREGQMCSLLYVHCDGDRPNEAMSCLNQSEVMRYRGMSIY